MSHAHAPGWVVFTPRPHRASARCVRGGHRGWGGGPGFGGPGGPGFGPRGRGSRARRGDVRAAALLLLEERPNNGYGLMQEIEERSDGLWRPSPGAVYPALAQLEDEGLIRSVERDAKKLYELTDEGRAHVEEHREHLGTPWKTVGEDAPEGLGSMRRQFGQLAMAMEQVVRGGSPEQIAAARKILDDARKAMYRLLAGDDE